MKKTFLVLASIALFISSAFAEVEAGVAGNGPKPYISHSIKNDTSQKLRLIPPIPPVAGKQIREIPRLPLSQMRQEPFISKRHEVDPALQDWAGTSNAPSPVVNFDGVSNVNGVLPPDPNGDVGPDHYVQMVNLSFAVWDKNGNLLYGPAANNTLWSGFGGPCETINDGDPIVLYDHLADRWLMSQFALPNFPSGPFFQCIAISQTGDPTGAWHRYEFQTSAIFINDYPKFGLWPDAYYMAVNQFLGQFLPAGQGVAAFERDKMLSGLPAVMIYFDLSSVYPELSRLLPSDLDGPNPPPAGSPNYFVRFLDDAWGYPQDRLEVWQFHFDPSNPANSTFTGPQIIDLTSAGFPFDSNLCFYSRNCLPQPGGSDVDALSDVLMYRLQYRNFGTHESLVVNHTVDVDGTDHAGIRWYEIRDPGGAPPTLFQAGTYAPDTDHRWMGSIAMDGAGDMGLGYSVSSNTTFPSIRYTGRLESDPPGILPQGETELMPGSGFQTHSTGRWGDYSMMAVDPADDCTFWYTQEYYGSVSSASWRTRIGSFKFPSCTPLSAGILQGAVTDFFTGVPIPDVRVDAGAYTTFTDTAGAYSFLRLPVGTYDATVSANGYAPTISTGIAVNDNVATMQDFALNPLLAISSVDTGLYPDLTINGFGFASDAIAAFASLTGLAGLETPTSVTSTTITVTAPRDALFLTVINHPTAPDPQISNAVSLSLTPIINGVDDTSFPTLTVSGDAFNILMAAFAFTQTGQGSILFPDSVDPLTETVVLTVNPDSCAFALIQFPFTTDNVSNIRDLCGP